ncbi:hypothetical protein HYR69_09235 [Candidatus Sumerlaeota bacterium]|nr:hypothetical protein [Candidatus Sumerlaeota bacterium]
MAEETPTPKSQAPNSRALLELYPTREAKIARIRAIEKSLEKMENDDEENDPVLIAGHIRLTRGIRMGCGVFFLCIVAMCLRVYHLGHHWVGYLIALFGAAGLLMILRGILYRPDPKMIQEAYKPHRGTPEYRALVDEMDLLARALSQDLRAEDEAKEGE